MIGGGIAVDSNCNAYVSAGTNYSNMLPLVNAYQGSLLSTSGTNAWLAQFTVPSNSNCGSDYIVKLCHLFRR